jgi:plasmid maintenance system antidote protein VapI
MNSGKSIKIAIVQNDRDSKWLAEQMDVSVSRVNALKSSASCNTETLERLANIFNMTVSEFIALGE